MYEIRSLPGKFSGYGLVRDKDGKPKIDDIDNIPKQIWILLTEDEQRDIENERNARRSNP